MCLHISLTKWGKSVKTIKLICLGTAAGFVITAGAQAADLPSRKAAPVEFVKVCDAYGAGFFYIPGSDTCLRVGGYVRAEYQFTPGHSIVSPTTGAVTLFGANQDNVGMEFRGRVDLDARTQSAWGTVQTVVLLRGTNADGIRAGSTSGVSSASTTSGVTTTSFGSTGYTPGYNQGTQMTMERAYIRFAGVTAGVGSDNFVNYPSVMYTASGQAGFPNGIKQLAYTATFGGGFSATIAVESKRDLTGSASTGAFSYINQVGTDGYLGVGNIRADQSWGFVQLSGAIGNNSANTISSTTYTPTGGINTYGAYAIGLNGRINLPMLAPGDTFSFNLAYAKGLLGYTGCSTYSSCSDSSNKRTLGGVLYAPTNLVLTTATTYGTTTSWSVGGLLTHYWSPSWRSNFNVGYTATTVPSSTVATTIGNSSIWLAAASLVWSPVKDFDIGVEVAYLQNKIGIQNQSAAFIAAGRPGLSNSGINTRLRLERSF